MMTPHDYVKVFGGELHDYVLLLFLTDCATLEKEFAQAEEESQRQEDSSPRKKALVGYMVAISDRMLALGCSGDY